YSNTTASQNHFEGVQAGYYNTTGANNLFLGYQAGFKNTTGATNVMIGNQAGYNHSTGDYNIFIGWQAGINTTTGGDNIFIGRQSGSFQTNGNHLLYIGNTFNDDPLIWGDMYNEILRINGCGVIKNISYSGNPILELDDQENNWPTFRWRNKIAPSLWWDISAYLDPQQQGICQMVWKCSNINVANMDGLGNFLIYGSLFELSDSTQKKNITPIQHALSGIEKINAVTYNWKDAKSRGERSQIGFLAQEVEQAFPQLVRTDEKGEKSVSYTHMVPVLLQAIKEQQAEIDTLKTKQAEMTAMQEKLEHLESVVNQLLQEKGK
ncbi:MAG TPA: tail fiber domain-containing protein, partial [Saprospiraceae bacterium]|nr:tail fiber domain-containing protein [Saprospiraceae bacterium]